MFDFYQATIEATPRDITEALISELKLEPEDAMTGGSGYKHRRMFRDAEGDSHVILFHGGANARPSLKASSHPSERVASLVRERWSDHSVSRVDIAFDYSHPGGFQLTCEALDKVTRANGVKSGYGIIPREPEKGMTFYCGSNSSSAKVRCYEKGKEQLTKGRVTKEEVDLDWFRVEFELRPNKAEEKAVFARYDENWMLGHYRWVKATAEAVLLLQIPNAIKFPHQSPDLDKSMIHAIRQNAATFNRYARRENNRSYGLVKPTDLELLAILFKEVGPQIIAQWEENDRKHDARAVKRARPSKDPSSTPDTPTDFETLLAQIPVFDSSDPISEPEDSDLRDIFDSNASWDAIGRRWVFLDNKQ